MKKVMTKSSNLLVILSSLVCLPAGAETSSQDVFARVDQNIENVRANQKDCERNRGTVDANLQQIQSAKSQAQSETQKIKSELNASQRNLSEVEKNLEQFKKSEDSEKRAIGNEERKINDLEAMLLTLRASVEKRKANLAQMNDEKGKVSALHSEWKARTEQLQRLQSDSLSRENKIAQEEKEWKGKRSKYDKDIERWGKTLNEQEKLKQNLASLKGSGS